MRMQFYITYVYYIYFATSSQNETQMCDNSSFIEINLKQKDRILRYMYFIIVKYFVRLVFSFEKFCFLPCTAVVYVDTTHNVYTIGLCYRSRSKAWVGKL